MGFPLFANNAKSTLASAVTSNTQATLTLQTGQGARFPSPLVNDWFLVTIDDGTNVEICKCVARSTDTLTVIRGVEGTTAQSSFGAGSKVKLRVTAGVIDWLDDSPIWFDAVVKPVTGVGSLFLMGVNAPTLVGAFTAPTKSNSSYRDQMNKITIASAVISASVPCQLRHTVPMASGQAGFRFYSRFGLRNIPNSSHWFIGLVNTTGQVASLHPPSSLTNAIVIGQTNLAQGGNLSIWRNGASGSAVQTDLGSYFTANTTAWFHFEVTQAPNDTGLSYSVKRMDVTTIAEITGTFSTSIPPASLWLTPYFHGTSMVNSVIQFDFGGWALENN